GSRKKAGLSIRGFEWLHFRDGWRRPYSPRPEFRRFTEARCKSGSATGTNESICTCSRREFPSRTICAGLPRFTRASLSHELLIIFVWPQILLFKDNHASSALRSRCKSDSDDADDT